ncbi:MAG: flagellar basal body-associated protein FliL [Aliivibrio sp.]|uniref:flagellar basal body-associated protein FliL n=1 Tax=Aliivibrio sp. TaxID=1872443 RepID=UPI001A543883|nr:flagellar basal body-associated protein FliL [Aliivibrio sp.]
MKKNTLLALFLLALTPSFSAFSIEESEIVNTQLGYYTLEPDITTNFVTTGKKLGYIKVRIDLLVPDIALLPILEKHNPLVRDAIISILGQQREDQIKSLSGREAIRKESLKQINELLLIETGQTVVADLLFTKFLYQ